MPSEDTRSIPHESSISCESCRQKKCRCDRRLPHCSQCSSGPSRCVYPEVGKRGLPLGYLNQLERRLAETEAALYGALVTLREMQPTSVIQASAKQDSAAKSARMNEWSRLPLRNWSDMERWQIAVSDHFSLEQISAETPNTNSSSTNAGPGPLHSTLGDVVASGYIPSVRREPFRIGLNSSYIGTSRTEMESSMHPRESVVMPGPTSSRIEAHGVLAADQFGHESDVTRQSTRAEELSRSSTLYF